MREHVDVAPQGQVRWWSGGEKHALQVYAVAQDAQGHWRPGQDEVTGQWHLGLEWAEPRDVREVVVTYVQQPPADVQVQYWRHNWPTPAPERRPGARRGWIGRDDPWHGHWTTVRGEMHVTGNRVSLRFDPTDLAELGQDGGVQLEEAENYLAPFRRTLKIRVVSGGEEPPVVAGLHAYTTATLDSSQVTVRLGVGKGGGGDWSGWADVVNGEVVGVELLDGGSDAEVQPDHSWQCRAGAAPEVRLQLRHGTKATTPGDEALLTVHTQEYTFTARLSDLEKGPLYLPDYGIYVAGPDHPDFASYEAQLGERPASLYDRVEEEPEQSLQRALAEIPPLDVTKQAPFGRYVVLGMDGGRQEWGLRYNGELFADKRDLKLLGRDAAKLMWPGQQLRFRFGSGDPPDFRERVGGTEQSRWEGWLPVFESRWLDREIEYRQTAWAAPLWGKMQAAEALRGDEDVVALVRFCLHNTTQGAKRVQLWMVLAPQEEVELREGLLLGMGRVVPDVAVVRQWRTDRYPRPYLRCAVDIGQRGELTTVPFRGEGEAATGVPTALHYSVELAEGESHTLTLAMPFVSLSEEGEWQLVRELDFDQKLADVIHYWRSFVEKGGRLELPEGVLADFHKAVRVHVAITADKDPASGLFVVPAATWRYGACGNEACWQITMLDQAGHHRRAELYLETFLTTQGVAGPDGKFESKEGAFQGLDLDNGEAVWSHFGYNLDHGYILECLANHYRYSGDADWLGRVAPHLVAACDFIIRERQATKQEGEDGEQAVAWGLLPAGHLEDNPEWRHWFAVNAHAHAGLEAAARVLAEIGHAEAGRLAGEAAAYREDIRRAAWRSMELAPVERLADGTAVPHVPTHTGIRGREWGWFREAAYGALHLMECGVFDPWELPVTWLLKDLEDNLFISRDWGRPVDRERYWFSHGGVTIQANLMDLGIDYLRRGQVKHALRALFNNFGASLYPDLRVFTEHPVVELGHGVGPFYKTPDEAKSLIWLRAFLLREEDDTLHLAQGAPRAWMAPGQQFGVDSLASMFGPVTYQVKSTANSADVQIRLPAPRNLGKVVLHLRRSDGRPMQSVNVNGNAHANFDPEQETVTLSNPTGDLGLQVAYTG